MGNEVKKVLYFEGAGCAERGEVENCRIRTAYRDNNGNAIYLEMLGTETNKYTMPRYKQYKYLGHIDFAFIITGSRDDCNKNRLPEERSISFEYNKANILSIVNSLGGGSSFDEIVILPDLAGYRVHADSGYNFGDAFDYNPERTARATEIYNHYYKIEQSEGKQYPNFSLWVDAKDPELLHLIRHFNGYNKHWTIRNIADWANTVTECLLGQCAC